MKKAVVIGVTYSTRLNLTRALSRAGYDVTMIYFAWTDPSEPDDNPPFDAYSNCISAYYHSRKLASDLIPLLLDKCTDPEGKVLLLPACDYSIALIDANQDVLKEHFIFPHISHKSGEMTELMDKNVQKALAREMGLNVAEAIDIVVKNGEFTIPDNVRYPCFPKPASSFKGGKGGLVRCDDESQLSAAISTIVQKGGTDLTVLVEEFIDIESEYALVGFSDGHNVSIPALLKLLVISKAYHGIALKGKVFPTDGYEALMEQFKALVIKTGFIGIVDIDFYKSGGKFYFGEMNLRFGGSGEAVSRMGANLPQMFVRSMTEGVWKDVPPVRRKAIYANDKLCMDDLKARAISFWTLLRYLCLAGIRFMPDKNDPEPYRRFRKEFVTFGLKLEIKKMLGVIIPKYKKYRQVV